MQSPLLQIRSNLKMNQIDLADLAKVSQTHISQVERGVSTLSANLINFLNTLHVDTEKLVESQVEYMEFVKCQRKEKVKSIQM